MSAASQAVLVVEANEVRFGGINLSVAELVIASAGLRTPLDDVRGRGPLRSLDRNQKLLDVGAQISVVGRCVDDLVQLQGVTGQCPTPAIAFLVFVTLLFSRNLIAFMSARFLKSPPSRRFVAWSLMLLISKASRGSAGVPRGTFLNSEIGVRFGRLGDDDNPVTDRQRTEVVSERLHQNFKMGKAADGTLASALSGRCSESFTRNSNEVRFRLRKFP